MEGRVQDLARPQLRCAFDYVSQNAEHFFVCFAVIQVCVFLRVPQTDGKHVCASGSGECDLAFKSLLFAKQGNNFLLKGAGKSGESIWVSIELKFCVQTY